MAPVEGEIKERLVGVADDSSESEDEDEGEGEEGGAETGEANAGEGWESMDED